MPQAATTDENEQRPLLARLVGHRRLVIILFGITASLVAYFMARSIMGEAAARVVGILALAAIFWATEVLPLFATAFLVIGLEILTLASDGGLADYWTRFLVRLGIPMEQGDEIAIQATTFITPFASDIIILFMGGFLLSAAITKHGVDQVIAGKILHPFTRSPLWLIFGVLGLTAFMSMWMSNTATAAMMITVVGVVVAAMPEEQVRFRRAIFLAVPFGANIGGVGTPIGTPPNAIAFGALNAAGYEMSFLKWMVVMLPIAIVMLGVGGVIYDPDGKACV